MPSPPHPRFLSRADDLRTLGRPSSLALNVHPIQSSSHKPTAFPPSLPIFPCQEPSTSPQSSTSPPCSSTFSFSQPLPL
jgi:hypothetical protein